MQGIREQLTEDMKTAMREKAAEQFDKGGRPELAGKERAEIIVVQGYLPAQMDDDAVRLAVEGAIEETRVSSLKEMGKVMGVLSKQLAGQATGARISQIVKELLSA